MNNLKIAIITVNTNKKDDLKPIGHYNPEWDYFCFTDDPEFRNPVYQAIPVKVNPDDSWETKHRRVKKLRMTTHLHQLLKGYDIHLVHDANIQIIADPTPLIKKCEGGIYLLDHWINCTYDALEMKRDLLSKGMKHFDAVQNLNNYEKLLRDRGFPVNSGYWSCGLQIRDLRNENVVDCMNEWVKEYDQSIYRDQPSFPWAVKQSGVKLIVADGHVQTSGEFKRHFKYHKHLKENH